MDRDGGDMGAVAGYDIPPREPEVMTCPACDGTGREYRALNLRTREDAKVTEAAWLCLPPGEDEAEAAGKAWCRMDPEPCALCGGDGVICDI